jgi:hypothetical protein
MSDDLEAKEPVVLDAEGHVLHDPAHPTGEHKKANFKVVNFGGLGIVPKILLGGSFIILLGLGLTVAGVALGVILVTFLARTLFKPRKQ